VNIGSVLSYGPIYLLTNSNRCGNLWPKVLLAVSPFLSYLFRDHTCFRVLSVPQVPLE